MFNSTIVHSEKIHTNQRKTMHHRQILKQTDSVNLFNYLTNLYDNCHPNIITPGFWYTKVSILQIYNRSVLNIQPVHTFTALPAVVKMCLANEQDALKASICSGVLISISVLGSPG